MPRTAVLSLVLAACASDGSDAPLADDEAKQIAMSIASTLRPVSGGGELGAMLDATALVRGDMPADLQREDERTVRGQRAGFSFRYELACRDDHNVPRGCDRFTANADVDASWSAVLASEAFVMVSTREGAWIINDITPDRARVDGESHLEYASRVTATDEGHALSYDASYRGITWVRGERWPRGGVVRYELIVDDPRQRTGLVRAEARFAASGHATIELPDHAFDLDLATGIVRPAHDDAQTGVQ